MKKSIPVHLSLEAAQRVLREIQHQIPEELIDYCSIEVMANCREQALVLNYGYAGEKQPYVHRVVAFCENRNTDAIRVYWGNGADFNNSTNQPATDNVWDRAKFFAPDQTAAAAAWIIRYIQTGETSYAP